MPSATAGRILVHNDKKWMAAKWPTGHDHPQLWEENPFNMINSGRTRRSTEKGQRHHRPQLRKESECHAQWRRTTKNKQYVRQSWAATTRVGGEEKVMLEDHPQKREEKFKVLPTQGMRSKEWKSPATAGGKNIHAREWSEEDHPQLREGSIAQWWLRVSTMGGQKRGSEGERRRAGTENHRQSWEEGRSPQSRHGSEREGRRARAKTIRKCGKRANQYGAAVMTGRRHGERGGRGKSKKKKDPQAQEEKRTTTAITGEEAWATPSVTDLPK
jgi:hypothetical protein